MPLPRLSLSQARRIALAAQGFDRARPARPGIGHLRRLIHRLGLLQIDFVNVLLPAHYLVPFSRLGPYDRAKLDDLAYRRREFTEQWAHEASIVPMEAWPLLRHRRATHPVRPWGFDMFLERHAAYVAWVMDEVRRRGPLAANELPEPDTPVRRIADQWGWGLAVRRQVLEAHFGRGRLAVADRLPNFARTYDLAERVIPRAHFTVHLPTHDEQRALVSHAARAHGVATSADLADYYRMPVRVERWKEPAFLHHRARTPRAIDAAALLSPFDPVVWYRDRAARLFGFDYRIEIFVPQEQRKWGYYVLPFLLGDRLVARVDLQADRKGRRLLVPAAYREPDHDPQWVAHALAQELRTLGAWLDLDDIVVGRHGGLARALRTALAG
ncbi:MAG TPA: crosslink repair DNA glycosylase YcaQ family protein [Gemmatimonadales bacterium]